MGRANGDHWKRRTNMSRRCAPNVWRRKEADRLWVKERTMPTC